MKRSVALRVGRALLLLQELKQEQGIDWCLHSSWASDQPVVIALVRPESWRGSKRSLGKPLVAADVESVLRGAESLLGAAVEKLRRKRKEKRRAARTA